MGREKILQLSKDEENALKILDYWFMIEFLNQQSLKTQKDTGNKAWRYKNAYATGRIRKKKLLTDFIQIKPGETLNDIVTANAQKTELLIWGDFEIFIGRMRKEFCIQTIAKNIDWEDMRPEDKW